MSTKKKCLSCNQNLIGRSDKKFCDDQCRSNYNRSNMIKRHQHVKNVNLSLKTNRSILIKMNPNGKTKVSYKDMLKHGFDFGYFTSILKTKNNTYYYFCYEMGYLPLINGDVLLVKKEDHVRMNTMN